MLIYLPWFFILEQTINADTPGMHIIDTTFDQMIPFCEIFVIPYYFWFVYVIGTCLFFMIYGTDKEFIRMALSLIIGMSLCLIICMIYPNGLDIRPQTLPDNLFGKLVASLYVVDTPYNVFPSIHVYNSVILHVALNRCEALKDHRGVRIASLVICILICLSTLFLKQHSVKDVCGGIAMSAIMYCLVYIADYRKLHLHNI